MVAKGIGPFGDVDFERIDTATDGSNIVPPRFTLGTKVQADDGCTYQYVKSTGVIAVYSLVKISSDGLFTVAAATTTTNPSTQPAKVGAAQTAFPSGTSYGWVAVGPGPMTVLCAADCVQDVVLYTTATDGVVDDTATTRINGLKLITTIVAAAASPCFACTELTTVAAAN